jgi:hypothetical protein
VIPFGLSEAQFSARYQRVLDAASPVVIGKLRELFSRRVNPDVLSARVEIFVDDDGGVPSAWLYYRGENNKVDHKDQSLFAGRSLNLELPLSALSEFDECYFRSMENGEYEFRGIFLAGNLLKAWFAESWWKAGGWAYSVPTALSVHDGRGDGRVIQLTEAAG